MLRASLQRVLTPARLNSTQPLYLNPHKWKGLPADQIFELHDLRRAALKDKYVPNDEERTAILSTFTLLIDAQRSLKYVYEIDHFREKLRNDEPVAQANAPPKLSNISVAGRGASLHEQRRNEQLHRVQAYEMPLLAQFRRPFVPPNPAERPVELTFFSDFADGAQNRKVQLSVKLGNLQLSPALQHKLKVIAGNKFCHNTQTLHFACTRFPGATQNARWLVERLNALVAEARDLTDDFADIPVNTHNSVKLRKKPEFPKEWRRPEDAPRQPNALVQQLVSRVVQQKDREYIKSVSP